MANVGYILQELQRGQIQHLQTCNRVRLVHVDSDRVKTYLRSKEPTKFKLAYLITILHG